MAVERGGGLREAPGHVGEIRRTPEEGARRLSDDVRTVGLEPRQTAAADTIFALASGVGRAGIAVIRVSGPQAGPLVRHLTGRELPKPRQAVLRRLGNPRTGEAVDDALVIWFPRPRSFTGEDMAELQLHGGRAVLAAATEALRSVDGMRPAEAGEFTRRAFANGKLDLTAAEGLADLINAETEAQRRQALRQLQGELGRLYGRWSERLVHCLAWLEASIDFADEDVPTDLAARVHHNILELLGEITQHLGDDRRGESLREGIAVALLGAPNAGKSSLLNFLAGRDAAIVSTKAGTTRDVIEVHLDLGGYPIILADTAGLREATDEVEIEGVRRALARAESADVKIALFDSTVLPRLDAATVGIVDDQTIVVATKCDLSDRREGSPIAGRTAIPTSVKTGEGLMRLVAEIQAIAEERLHPNASPPLTRERHRRALEECAAALKRASMVDDLELVAEDVRMAVRALGRITGTVDIEDVLDAIFREFCIGK